MANRAGLRRDTARTRDRLLDAAGGLLADRGLGFSLPDLARASGVATATVYRHFDDVHQVHREFHCRMIDELVARFAASDRARGRARLEQINDRWADLALRWGRASVHIRSSEGFLERMRASDQPISELYAALSPVVDDLVVDEVIPKQDLNYALLLWITIFDERVIVDLAGLGWTARRISRTLTASLLAAWQAGDG